MSSIGCRPLDNDELEAVVASFHGPYVLRNRALFVLGYTTGFRISELLSLCIGDVFHHDQVLKRVVVQKRHRKGRHGSHSATLPPRTRRLLDSWIRKMHTPRERPLASPLFPSRKGTAPLSRVQAHRILRTAYDRAQLYGPPGTLATHCMRKTFADRMYVQLGDVFKVQKALGHKSPASTVAYLSFQDEDLVTAVHAAYHDPLPAFPQRERNPTP